VSAGWWAVAVIAFFGACFLVFLAWALFAPHERDVWGDEDETR
jgi:threonine/homoserine/homoserine lactone efflux protein